MGVATLISRTDPQVITAEWWNGLRAALLQDLVPRNSSGVPEDLAGELGTVDYSWRRVRAKEIILDGSPLELSSVTGRRYKITSGKAEADGFPNFLTAAGSGNGLSATLDAGTTNFEALVNGSTIELTSNIQWLGLTAAPSSNNTADINDSAIGSSDDVLTRGEIGNKAISLDAVGSEWESVDGDIVAVLTPAGEVMLGTVSAPGGGSGSFLPRLRGWAGTDRQTLADNGTLTLLKINTLLLKADGSTLTSSDFYPESIAVAPTVTATAGKVYFERSTQTQKYDDGTEISSEWLTVGYAVCDDTDCLYVQEEDFDLSWADNENVNFFVFGNDTLRIQRGSSANNGSLFVEFHEDVDVDRTGDLDSGQTIQNNEVIWIYLTNTGSVVLSHVVPRPFDHFKRGRYHPAKYYRSLGSVQLGSGGTFITPVSRRSTAEKISEALVPVGAVIPIVTGYFGNATNGSFTTALGNSASLVDSRTSPNWRACDGSEIDDPESPFFRGSGRFLPFLTDGRFIMANSSAGGSGGSTNITPAGTLSGSQSLSHTHAMSHVHQWVEFNNFDNRIYGLNAASGAVSVIDTSDFNFATADRSIGGTSAQLWGNNMSSDESLYTTGVINPVNGTDGSDARTGTPAGGLSVSFSNATFNGSSFDNRPLYMSAIYVMRVK